MLHSSRSELVDSSLEERKKYIQHMLRTYGYVDDYLLNKFEEMKSDHNKD